MAARKRDRLQVIHDILRVIRDNRNKIKPTHLLYKSNLSHQMMKDYVEELLGKELITQNQEGRTKFYQLTDKGFTYLDQYNVVTSFLESFGLE
ncbi:MAG: winged helix-turn-helix domain-containing protein [Candidatus Nanoarchaeia archaeon]